MSKTTLALRIHRLLEAFSGTSARGFRKPELRHRPALEFLEGRALMAGITAGAVVTSAVDGANFDYTISLTNSSTSTSGIGTFWYAWVPGKDFLATSPISVTPPTGWTDSITHEGPSDGYAIQFVSSNPIYNAQPGGSLNFSFKSADASSSIGGNSVFFPGTPVGTSFVYPGAPFSDAGHEFVATSTSTSSSTPPSTSSSPVTITGVSLIRNKRHVVTGIAIQFSGALDAPRAESAANFKLVMAGRRGSFVVKNSALIKLKRSIYDGTNHVVMLTPRRTLALTKPVELLVEGGISSGLQDSQGQPIDGDRDGRPGGDGVAVIRRNGVSLE